MAHPFVIPARGCTFTPLGPSDGSQESRATQAVAQGHLAEDRPLDHDHQQTGEAPEGWRGAGWEPEAVGG